MARHNTLGKAGEDAVRDYLICKGYTIRETNWRCGKLELDMVVQKDAAVIFVEVKTRASENFNPALAITDSKVRNIINAAKGYLRMYNIPQLSIQIDIIYVIGQPGNFKIYHAENAVQPRLRAIHTSRH
ncbi:MAG: YraN family protein [Muribaculaceae bacterium]